MITAQDLQKALSVLERVEKLTLAQSVDIDYMSRLRMDALFAASPFKVQLCMLDIPVQKNISDQAFATSQC